MYFWALFQKTNFFMDATTSFLQSMPFERVEKDNPLEGLYIIAVLSRECSLLGR